MVPIINSFCVRVVFWLSLTMFCEPCVTSCTTFPWTSWKRNGQGRLQLTTHGFHNRKAAWADVGSGTFKNPLQAQFTVNWWQLLEIKLKLYLKFVRYYARLLFCSIYSQQSLHQYSKFQVGNNSATVRNRTRLCEILITKTSKSFPAVIAISHESTCTKIVTFFYSLKVKKWIANCYPCP